MISVFERNPKKTLLGVVATLMLLLILILEIALRFIVPYNIGYYTAVREPGKYVYPYGTITVNSEDYPDSEFDLSSTKPRVGYFGDSIIMGIGAGDGYRISDLLEAQYPAFEHWTFGIMGNGLNEKQLLDRVGRYKINHVIYGFNLNDFVEAIDDKNEPVITENQSFSERALRKALVLVRSNFDGLRGKSYLYTALRTGVKNILQRQGFGYSGFKESALFPHKNAALIEQTAARMNHARKILAERGIDFCLIVFPYEMQISKEAAQIYRELGITWEDGFTEGSTQKLFIDKLDFPFVYDGREAFSSNEPAGTYFVYNKGDKIDFNHPNREGHALLTKGFTKSRVCPFLR